MPFYLRYSMSTGSGRREAKTAEQAAEIFAELRMAGATVDGVSDGTGRVYSLSDLIPDPMELAEIEYLAGSIRLIEARLGANDDGSVPRTDEDIEVLSLELERARAQLARVLDHYRKEI